MTRSVSTTVAVILLLALLGSCGFIPGVASPADAADDFYACQSPAGDAMPEKLFIDEATEMHIMALLKMRNEKHGAFVSHRKIGSNRQISVEAGGRQEMVTYIFEVSCENGRTRETLMIKRGRITDPFRIASYEIEELQRDSDPAPMGTSSA